MIEFDLEFGGFYYSTHSDRIDNDIETLEYDFEQIDWKKTHLSYAESFLNNLNYEFDLDLGFLGLNSPREYNFTTDKIICSIKNKDFKKIKAKYTTDTTFAGWVNENSKSRDGFFSFYSGIEEVVKEDSVLLQYIFKYMLYVENEYFDNDCTYDFEYEIIEE